VENSKIVNLARDGTFFDGEGRIAQYRRVD